MRAAARRGATGEGGDGRKNDGHKYRSYLCFMTVRPRYRQEESARIRGKAPTIDSQILTDVLAQWIPVSPVEPPPLSLFFSLFSSLLVEGGPVLDRRMASVATQSAICRCRERRSESSISPLRLERKMRGSNIDALVITITLQSASKLPHELHAAIFLVSNKISSQLIKMN